MKHTINPTLRLFTLLLLFANQLFAENSFDDFRETFGKTFFNPRSPTLNKAQESSGVARFIGPTNNCSIDGFASLTSEFGISFNKNSVGQYIFFTGSSTMMTGTAGGPGVDIFGPNFLLNDNFTDAITARPQVKTEVIDASFYCSLDPFLDGLYVIAHVPICWAHWNVDLIESNSFIGNTIQAFELGNPVAVAAPFNSLIDAWNGQATFFDVKQPLQYGRINGTQKKFKGGDIELAVGYFFKKDECEYISLNARVIIPTSNKPQATYFFEPCTGNFHHYEVGFGIIAGSDLWYCNDKCLQGFINANLYHVCKNKQKRTFDLTANGPGSRYLLFKTFDPTGHYAGEIVRGPNILTLDINTNNAIHGDAVFMLDYNQGGFNWNIGYNIWGRTKDKITLNQTIPEATYGIAGLTGTNPATSRDRTASQTTISGENASDFDGGPTGTFLNNVYLTTDDLNISSAAHPGCFSHGIFTYIGYVWNCDLEPFTGLGTEVEFSGSKNDALRVWHIWAKIGLHF